MKKLKTFLCSSIVDHAHTVTLYRDKDTRVFTIVYGDQEIIEADEEKALDHYIGCLGHAMQCAALLPITQRLGRHEDPFDHKEG